MVVAVFGIAVIAKPQEREVVRVGLEPVLAEEELVKRSKLRMGYLDCFPTDFTHEVFVVVVQRDVPSSGLTVSQRNVVDQPDTGQIVEDAVNGGRFYPTRALQHMVDDHPRADERLITRYQGANYGSSGKGQAQSGFPDSLNQQVFS
jgi:uncharacterized protein YnzC (UPF0291/DUF896 family)